MASVNTAELLHQAMRDHIAIPAFNIDNLESAIAVSEAMKELKTPVIVQTIPRTLSYGGVRVYPAMIQALMADSDCEYGMHLDHGNGIELSEDCLKAGFTSVMFDGSMMSLEENINATCKVAKLAHLYSASCEGELGTIGGKEETESQGIKYTEVNEAIEFVDKSKVDFFAIAVGTAHGIYKGEPIINTIRIGEIKNAVPATPLVLHGASGLKNEIVTECIRCGISKINFATELRQAFTESVRNSLLHDAHVFDPKLYLRQAIDNIKHVVISKINLCYGLK